MSEEKKEEMKEPDVTDDINAMLESLGSPIVEETKDDPEKPPEEKEADIKEEEPPEKPPEELEAKEEKEELKEEETPPEPETPPAPSPDDKDKVIEELRAKLAAKETPEESPKPEPKSEEPKFDEQDFLGELDYDTVMNDPKELNKLLNKVYQQAAMDNSNKFQHSLPDIVRDQVVLIQNLQKAGEQFYKDNPDLAGFPKAVSTVFRELVDENPDRTYGEVFKDVSVETRKRLGLPTPEKGKKPDSKSDLKLVKEKSPRLPSRGSRAGQLSDEKPSGVQSELDDMNKAIGR